MRAAGGLRIFAELKHGFEFRTAVSHRPVYKPGLHRVALVDDLIKCPFELGLQRFSNSGTVTQAVN